MRLSARVGRRVEICRSYRLEKHSPNAFTFSIIVLKKFFSILALLEFSSELISERKILVIPPNTRFNIKSGTNLFSKRVNVILILKCKE